jgi:AraC family transcriptional regulator
MKQLKSGQHFGLAKKKLKLSGTTLTEAGYEPDIQVPWHFHENAYFFMHLRGRLKEVNKKNSITCTSGTLLFHHWQDPHFDTDFSVDASFFHIEIEDIWFKKYSLSTRMPEGSLYLENPLLKSIFRNVHSELAINDNATQLSIDGLLAQAFGLLIRQSAYEKNERPPWTKKVKEILHDAEPGQLSLQSLSEYTGLHPVYLSNQFSRYFGVGFGEYIRRLKLDKACHLLANSKLSITSIAYDCGFSDQSHFIRAFRQAHGITPLKFRNRLLNS